MKSPEIMSYSSLSLKKLAEKLGLEFSGNADLQITHVCGLDSLQKGGLAYLTSPDGLANVPVPAGMEGAPASPLISAFDPTSDRILCEP